MVVQEAILFDPNVQGSKREVWEVGTGGLRQL